MAFEKKSRVVKIQPIVEFVTRVELCELCSALSQASFVCCSECGKREKDGVGHGRCWHEEDGGRASWVQVRLEEGRTYLPV